MKAINYLIIKVEEAYNNTVTLENGKDLIVNTTIESVSSINRRAVVVSAPDFTILKEGDEVIVHHNITRLRNGIKGKVMPSNFFIKDDLYFVPLTEVFMYKRDSDWISLDPYCFVRPVESPVSDDNGEFLFSDLSKAKTTHKGNKKLYGVMEYPNKMLTEMGVTKGVKIVFSPDSEYEFKIDGQILYKMATNDIKIQL